LNENLATAKPGAARILDNWFPTSTTARVRGGALKYATVGDAEPVLSMWSYLSGSTEKFFAATEADIFDITTVADPDVIPTADVTGQTAGYYSSVQFGTAGGDYLYAVNGMDRPQLYDGADWQAVDSATRALPYDTQTGNFTAGLTVTGGTSGATGVIVADTDAGATGTLRLLSITGTFIDNEIITDSATGSATTNIPSGVSTLIGITGVTTSGLSQVWSYASRLFFVEKNTMLAWYLPVDSLGGAALSVSLAGVFKQGGALMFGAAWSLDAGDGLDDKCVFISTEGEVAVYEGTNPSDANNWRKVGVYQITRPLGIKGSMQAGGDLLVATETGVVPLSEAIKKDVAALSISAVSRNIEPAWKDEASARSALPWEILKWSTASMMIVSLPRPDDGTAKRCFVANMETGAWSRFTGWDTRCMALFGDEGYFGTNDGVVYAMERGGSDDAEPYVCSYVGQFDHLRSPSVTKTVFQARAIFTAEDPFNVKVSASKDYAVSLPVAPNSVADYTSAEWDVGAWDVDYWDSPESPSTAYTRWVSIGKTGFSIAPQIQITCGVTPTPVIELVSFDITYSTGAVVV
jgi:hypothetical protein